MGEPRTNARKRPVPKWTSEWDPVRSDWRIHRVVEHPKTKKVVRVSKHRPGSRLVAKRKRKLLGLYGPVCYLCEQETPPEDLRVEHKIPWSRGGGNNIGNLGLACETCDADKGNNTEEEYRAILKGRK